jgi:glycosyltransferase involved in cell wall biosynthesis
MACELTILMPCLNEAETLAGCIEKARHFLDSEHIQGEILIADNGSTDGSQAIAVATGARLISVSQQGYGAALKSGIEAAQGQYVIMGDADGSYDFDQLMPFLQRLREGYSLVMGNRFQGGIMQGAMPFLNRYVGNPILSFIGRVFFKSYIGDFHCGLRGFQREALLSLDLQGDGMEFASEMVVKATLQKLSVTEVATHLYPDGRSRAPHLRPWRDGWRHLRLLLLFCPDWLFLYPGLCLFFLGTLVMSILTMGALKIGMLSFDIHTMLFASMFMIIGLQGIVFSIFAKLIATYHLKIDFATSYLFRFLQIFTLEKGLLVGLFLMLIGLSGAYYSFWYWWHQAFGPLIPTQMMRVLIPSTTSLILGAQLLFASFFLGVLNLHYSERKGQSSVSEPLIEAR